jgi:DNA-binding CsgD family transcriptional regulator
MNTARSHVKHMFVKTGVSRQGELVRIMLAGLGSIREE